MLISELSNKELIDLNKGERLGFFGNADLEIDVTNGKIISVIVSNVQWFGLKKKGATIKIPWENIQKIGADMIMIENVELTSIIDEVESDSP